MEEKDRVLRHLSYLEDAWRRRGDDDGQWSLPGVPRDEVAVDGRRAYAREQASQFSRMRSHCVKAWVNIDAYVASKGVGTSLYSPDETEESDCEDEAE